MNREGFTFTGTGTLKRVDTFVSKTGKSILTLIFELHGRFPQTVPIKVFGRNAEREYKPGDIISIVGRLGGREWNGKVFGEAAAETVEVVGRDEEVAPRLPGVDGGPEDDSGVPF